jgi:hypothetical protein
MWIAGINAIPMMITCMLQGTFCNTGIPRTFYGGNICSVDTKSLLKSFKFQTQISYENIPFKQFKPIVPLSFSFVLQSPFFSPLLLIQQCNCWCCKHNASANFLKAFSKSHKICTLWHFPSRKLLMYFSFFPWDSAENEVKYSWFMISTGFVLCKVM